MKSFMIYRDPAQRLAFVNARDAAASPPGQWETVGIALTVGGAKAWLRNYAEAEGFALSPFKVENLASYRVYRAYSVPCVYSAEGV